MIIAGQTAYLKATDEVVFVLRVDETTLASYQNEFGQLSGQSAYVRRPTYEGEQITWHLERYAVEELETREENRSRRIAWDVETQKLIKAAVTKDSTPEAEFNSFLPN